MFEAGRIRHPSGTGKNRQTLDELLIRETRLATFNNSTPGGVVGLVDATVTAGDRLTRSRFTLIQQCHVFVGQNAMKLNRNYLPLESLRSPVSRPV